MTNRHFERNTRDFVFQRLPTIPRFSVRFAEDERKCEPMTSPESRAAAGRLFDARSKKPRQLGRRGRVVGLVVIAVQVPGLVVVPGDLGAGGQADVIAQRRPQQCARTSRRGVRHLGTNTARPLV